MKAIRIAIAQSDPVLFFAAEELAKYAKMMCGRDYIIMQRAYDPALNGILWLGVSLSRQLPSVDDAELDDAIVIDVSAGSGMITGTNPRAVLIGVYRFLTESGCAFLRPGPYGEVILHRDLLSVSVSICEKASCRHRAVCIEGAVSYENVVSMLDWLPKVGMSGYFTQFIVPFTFFNRWYTHQNNDKVLTDPVTPEDTAAMLAALKREIKRRGLLYHATGHGWTCDPFGVEGNTWDAREYNVPEKTKEILALVNGKRELWRGVPLNTNLCYSTDWVRERIASAITDYCQANPEVNYLHLWLADGSNNHCECDNCKNTRPSDYYIRLLNETDAMLTARGLKTRIVFLLYQDLLWEPEKETLVNPDRFVLMFAPTRTYSKSYAERDTEKRFELSPYVRNHCVMPASVEENIARLQRWQSIFHGDGFVFDYHYMWDHYKDAGYFALAKVLAEDMKALHSMGLNGMVSCQGQRVFFPSGLGMHAMAKALWDNTADFGSISADYFTAAYGAGGARICEIYATISSQIDAPYLRIERTVKDEKTAARYAAVPSWIKSVIPEIESLRAEEADPAIVYSYDCLLDYLELSRLLSLSLSACASGDMAAARTVFADLKSCAQRIEPKYQAHFDAYEYIRVIDGVLTRLDKAMQAQQK